MKINGLYIDEYKRLIQTTNLQEGYQEFVKFFRYLRTFLQKELPAYTFTNNIVENNMDYSYFQFTNEKMKSTGLKFVVAFMHGAFSYEIWLSGLNREAQRSHFDLLKAKGTSYSLTDNPNKTDYILRTQLIDHCNYDALDELMQEFKDNTIEFINNVEPM